VARKPIPRKPLIPSQPPTPSAETASPPANPPDQAATTEQPVDAAPPVTERLTDAATPAPELPAAYALPEPPAGEYITTLPSQRTLARWALVALALYAIGWLLWNSRPALLPFVIGLVLAYLLLPIVNRLARKMPRWLSILTVYVGGFVLITVSISYVAPLIADQIEQLIRSTPAIINSMRETGTRLYQQYSRSVPPSIQGPIQEGAQSALETAQANLATYAQSVGAFLLNQVLQVVNTVTFLIGFVIIPFWLFYILNDANEGRAFIDRLLHPRIRPDFWNVWGMTDQVLSNYIRGQLTLGVAVGGMVAAGLLILRLLGFQVPYILLLSIIAGLTELIPIVGPIIGAIPGIALGFFVDVPTGLAVTVVYVVVQQFENSFLVPRIIGESIGIHPAILTVLLIVMGHVYGLLGVILAAPVAAIGRDLFIYTYRRLEGFAPAPARSVITPEAKEQASKG
jgi:predicted PurR-regulated permease PerM